MGFEALANRLNKKLYRRKQRAMVKKWWDGDACIAADTRELY